jgi:predicted  nucleic acid-binding Zn-ribbon protein
LAVGIIFVIFDEKDGISAISPWPRLNNLNRPAYQQQQLLVELSALARQIERCAETIQALQTELAAVNARYPAQRTTREDIAFLTDLLKCANKKLGWEKQIASLKKRAPVIMEKMSALLHDEKNPPPEQARLEMLQSLKAVQAAMERLQGFDTI